MRPFRPVILAVLMSASGMLAAPQIAHAEQIFGTYSCSQQFSCRQASSDQLSNLAYACSIQGFTLPRQESNPFDGQSIDSDGCMTAPLSSGQGRSGSSRCCVVPHDGDNCTMRCQMVVQ